MNPVHTMPTAFIQDPFQSYLLRENRMSQAFFSLEVSNLHFVRKHILPYFIVLLLFYEHYYL